MKTEGDDAALSMVRAAARSVGPVGSLFGYTASGVLKYVVRALWLFCVGFLVFFVGSIAVAVFEWIAG